MQSFLRIQKVWFTEVCINSKKSFLIKSIASSIFNSHKKLRKTYDGKRDLSIILNTVSCNCCNCSIPFHNCRHTVFFTLAWHMIIGTYGHVWCGRMVPYGRIVPYGHIVPYGRMVPFGRISRFGGRVAVLLLHFDYLPLDSNSRTNS